MDRRVLRTFLLLLVAASMFPAHTISYYAETFTAICVAIGSVLAVFGRRLAALGGWALAALATANIPASLLGLGGMALVYTLRRRRLRYLAAILAAGALILAEAWLRRGSPFANGYAGDAGFHTVMPFSGGPGFNYPIFFGLLSILFSFGKGLIFFTPGLFLPVRRYLLAQGNENGPRLYTLYICSGWRSSAACCWSMRTGGRGMAAGSGGRASSSSPHSPPRWRWPFGCMPATPDWAPIC